MTKKKENVGGLIPGEGERDYYHDMYDPDEWVYEDGLRPYESRKKPKIKPRKQKERRSSPFFASIGEYGEDSRSNP